jgi:hypothetical protein
MYKQCISLNMFKSLEKCAEFRTQIGIRLKQDVLLNLVRVSVHLSHIISGSLLECGKRETYIVLLLVLHLRYRKLSYFWQRLSSGFVRIPLLDFIVVCSFILDSHSYLS